MKKILLSAYACEPNKGSEPGVGWDFTNELGKENEVWVLTRENNKQTIEEYLELHNQYKNTNIRYIYIGLPKWLTFWKKGRRGMRIFMYMWQLKAYIIAKKLCKEIEFDYVQHITFVSFTQPTYMYKLRIPMIWGPIAGGENIPKCIKVRMTNREKLLEVIRKASQQLAIYTPTIKNTLKDSKLIIVATEETKNLLPQKYHYKIEILPAIGINEVDIVKKEIGIGRKKRIIMAGRLTYLKGYEIGISAFRRLEKIFNDVELCILGEGELKDELVKLAGDSYNKSIFFVGRVCHDDIFDFYKDFDIFLNTSVRDSGCMTLLEAMSVGVVPVCIATGGPKILTNQLRLAQIEPESNEVLINNIKERLYYLLSNEKVYTKLKEDTNIIKSNFTYEVKVKKIADLIDNYCK